MHSLEQAERDALLEVARSFRRFDWDRFLIGWCSAFHGLVAIVLAVAPVQQLITQGTRPVFDLASRQVWCLAFLGVALLTLSLLRVQGTGFELLALLSVLFLGGVWLTTFVMAVLRGEGSAVAVVVWPFLYGPWLIVGARFASGRR